jgi:hypothetical protein
MLDEAKTFAVKFFTFHASYVLHVAILHGSTQAPSV